MKKLILAFLLAFMFVFPAVADTPVIYIDGVPQNAEIVWKDDRIYVPLRFVSEKLGAEVSWDGQAAQIETRKLKRPEIVGDSEFVKVVNESLDLLEERDFPHYFIICDNVDRIWMQEQVVVEDNAWALTFERRTIITQALRNDSKRFVPVYMAATLTHEATHSNSFRYSDEYDEYAAYSHGETVLKMLDAPQWMIDETERLKNKYKN